MALTDLVIAAPEEAQDVSVASSLDRWVTLDVSGAGDVPLHLLVAHLLDKPFQEVLDSAKDLIEAPVDAEPWDESAWVTPVLHLPRDYVDALASVSEDEISSLAQWWWNIEEFNRYRHPGCGISEEVLKQLLTEVRTFMRLAGDRSVLMRLAT
jgi:hypothetical protein